MQPSAAAALLNRVTGDTPSTIAGQLTSNGQVFIVNPNGIAITPSGVVNTGAFTASTLSISDQDFLAGDYAFEGDGSSQKVSNAGQINIATGGYAALIGGRVDNSGIDRCAARQDRTRRRRIGDHESQWRQLPRCRNPL